MSCFSCEQDAKWPDLPPREAIAVTDHWRVAHAFNSALPGWLVALARRHVLAIGELSKAELEPLGPLLGDLSRALAEVTGCAKTYVMQFAEDPAHAHAHFHVVPRMADWPEEVRGPNVFHFLKQQDPLSDEDRDKVALRLRAAL